MAMLEPMDVRVVISKYTSPPRSNNSWCDTPRPFYISEYRATATILALLLVSHEAHSVAKKFYKVLFRNAAGRYGVLAEFPTVLKLDEGRLLNLLLQNNGGDLGFVETFVFTATGGWKFSRQEALFADVILKMGDLRLLEIRIANRRIQNFAPQGSNDL
jgi:hypothetical protein